MQSRAANVESYLEEVPVERAEALRQLRALCLEVLGGFEESMVYGMPCYAKDGKVEVAFASQKNYISLYCLKESVVRSHSDLLAGLSAGKGCIRFNKPSQMDFERLRALLLASVASADAPC